MTPVRAARLLFQLPNSCRVYTKIKPASQWGWSEVLANRTNYLLEILAWQNATPHKKSKQAAHKANKPKPFVPDFMKQDVSQEGINEGSEALTVDDVDSILNMPRG